MGTYVEEMERQRYYEKHKEEFKLKVTKVKKIFGIPYLWIKENQYIKLYHLFNFIPLFKCVDYTGGNCKHV